MVDYPPARRADVKGVESGKAWFFAEGRGDGAVLLRGCSPATVNTGKSQEITVSLVCVCNPQAALCAPQPEVAGDGEDNDCDGITDEACDIDGDCDDQVACTHDSCLVATGECLNQTDDSLCPDDGLFCNGAEICDPLQGCTGSGDPCAAAGLVCDEDSKSCAACSTDGECADGHDCTLDACDAGGFCIHQPQDDLCPDDGTFCNGGEFCDALTGCQHRGDPCQGQEICDEQSRSCLACPECRPTWLFLPTAGGGSISLSGYRAELFLAPAGPAGKTWSGNYSVDLGPAAVAGRR